LCCWNDVEAVLETSRTCWSDSTWTVVDTGHKSVHRSSVGNFGVCWRMHLLAIGFILVHWGNIGAVLGMFECVGEQWIDHTGY